VQYLERNPSIVWRKERQAEADVLEALRRGEDASERGVVTLVLSGMMHQLNLFGGRIWELSDATRTADGIAAAIAAEFGWDEQLVRTDVLDFVQDLLQKGWLRHAAA
jgi:pyrroloquinoline quinone biosynthesis protein D